jgi:amidase
MAEARPSWQAIVERKRDERQSCLPTGWLIPDNELPSDSITDTTKICETSGWLHEQEVAITNLDLTDLAAAIREKRYTSVQVVDAFAHRATIAQQLVNV